MYKQSNNLTIGSHVSQWFSQSTWNTLSLCQRQERQLKETRRRHHLIIHDISVRCVKCNIQSMHLQSARCIVQSAMKNLDNQCATSKVQYAKCAMSNVQSAMSIVQSTLQAYYTEYKVKKCKVQCAPSRYLCSQCATRITTVHNHNQWWDEPARKQ